MNNLRDRENLWFWAALCFAAVAVFVNLGNEGIYAAQEGRTALILRNMFRTGDYLEMRVDYGVPYEKPIGHYWLCLPSAYFAGIAGDAMESAVELGIRLPSAFSSLLTVLLAGLLTRRIYKSAPAGAMAMVILSTMSNFDKLGRLGHIDMPLACAFMLAMYFLYTGYFEEWKPNWSIYLFYVALGWGLLLKGPLVLVLAALTVAGMAATRGRRWYEVPRDLRLVRGALIVLAIALPWYIYECIHSKGAFFDEFIVRQNLNRFTGDPAVYRKKSPIWHHIPKLLGGARPWSLAILAALIVYFKRLVRFRLSDGSRFLLIWFLTGFVFFSLSAVKRVDYLLPIFPPLAMMTARAVAEWCEKAPATPRKGWLTVWIVFTGILVVLYALNATGVLVRFGEAMRDGHIAHATRRDGMTVIMICEFLREHSAAVLAALAAISALLLFEGWSMGQRRYYRVFVAVALTVLGIFLSYHLGIEPGTDRMRSVKSFARDARRIVPPGDTFVIHGNFNTEMIYFMDRDYHRKIEPGDVWVIAEPRYLNLVYRGRPEAWREELRTIENHHYPAVLLKRLPAAAADTGGKK